MNSQTKTLILTGMSIVGVVATTILSNRATLKASDILKDEEKTVKEKAKETWKYYIPAMVAAGGTIACICINREVGMKAVAALASAGSLSGELVEKYRHAIKEKYGEEGLADIHQIIAESAENREIYSCGLFSMDKSLPTRGEVVHFYDETTDKWFDSTIPQVMLAEYHLNRNFALGCEETVAEWLDFLGLTNDIPDSDKIVWSMAEGYSWIDFDHTKASTEKGDVYYIISCTFPPEAIEQ